MTSLVLLLSAPFSFAQDSAEPSASAQNSESSGRNVGWDYNFSAAARTYPITASASAEGGYSQPLWGQWQNKSDVMYGYIRPSVKLSSAVIVNAAEAKLTIKPVSFLGFHAGKMMLSRSRDRAPGANCLEQECRGVLSIDFVQADLVLAAGPAVYLGTFETKDFKSLRDELDFYDDISAIVGRKGGDRIQTVGHTLGYRVPNDDLDRLIGLNFRRSDAELTRAFSERVGVVFAHKYQDYRILYLAGTYRSTTQKTDPTLAIQIDWLGGLKGLAL